MAQAPGTPRLPGLGKAAPVAQPCAAIPPWPPDSEPPLAIIVAPRPETGPVDDPNISLAPPIEKLGEPKKWNGISTLIGFFRETSAEGLWIRQRLNDAIQKAESGESDAAIRTFDDVRQLIRRQIGDAARRAVALESIRQTDPDNHARCARELVQIANGWYELDQLWPSTDSEGETRKQVAELVERAKETIRVLDASIFLCACVSIPRELDDYLENYRVGKRLDFVTTFRDQLPDDETTRKVLEWLAPQSRVVSGLIDLPNGQIVKADHRLTRQIFSVAGVLSMAGFGFVIAAIGIKLVNWLLHQQLDSPTAWAALSRVYMLVLLGVLMHWVLDRVQQSRAGSDIMPMAEWLMWIHVNEVSITVRIVTVWLIVFLSAVFNTIDMKVGAPPLTCFLAGYFLDSTFDALVGRLNTFIGNNDPAKKKARAAGN